jgi:hypothetical protein
VNTTNPQPKKKKKKKPSSKNRTLNDTPEVPLGDVHEESKGTSTTVPHATREKLQPSQRYAEDPRMQDSTSDEDYVQTMQEGSDSEQRSRHVHDSPRERRPPFQSRLPPFFPPMLILILIPAIIFVLLKAGGGRKNPRSSMLERALLHQMMEQRQAQSRQLHQQPPLQPSGSEPSKLPLTLEDIHELAAAVGLDSDTALAMEQYLRNKDNKEAIPSQSDSAHKEL